MRTILIQAKTAALFAIFCGVAFLASGVARDASGEETEAYGLDLTHYATVRRSDGSYRRMLITSAALSAFKRSGALPNGTRILMETYYSPGVRSTVFHAEKHDGRWRYGSFGGARVDLSTRAQASCLSCHARAADRGFVFTRDSIERVAKGGAPADFRCDRSGRAPCGRTVYRSGAAD